MTSDDSERDWQLLVQLTHAYRSLTESLMEEIGIHRAQAILLQQLASRDGQIQSELAGELSLHGATVTKMVQRLEEAELITRQRDPDDNRQVHVYLTERGRRVQHCALQQFLRSEDIVFADVSAEERDMLRELFHQLLDNMQAYS